jgi:hypothetical protein
MILVVFAFIVYVLRAIAGLRTHLRSTVRDLRRLREEAQGRPGADSGASAEMVRCLSCGAYVASRDAVVISSRGASQVFCSQACMRVRVAS